MENIIQKLLELAPDKKEEIEMFVKIIEKNKYEDSIKNIYDALQSYFIDEKISNLGNVRQNLACNFIHYCNQIFILLGINTFGNDENALSDVFKAIFKKNNIYYQDDFFSRFNSSNNPNFKTMQSPFKDCKVLYDLRNAYNHSILGSITTTIKYKNGEDKTLNDDDFFSSDVKACLRVFLYATKIYLHDLKEALKKDTKINFTKYLENVKTRFVTKFKKYVQIRTEQDLTITRNAKESQINFDKDAKPPITGTVEQLRNDLKQIPKKRMILQANAGMGKSTTLENLAYTDADKYLQQKSKKLPVFLEMGLLIDKDKNMMDYIWEKINESTSIDKSFVEDALKEGNINLFIDALNEIPKNLQQKRQQEIQILCDTYPNTYIIISTRKSHNPFPNIPVLILQKMNDKELEEFLEKNTQDKPQVAQKIKQKFADKDFDFLKDACRQYFMFSRLIEIVAEGYNFPEHKDEIVSLYLEFIFDREYHDKKDVDFDNNRREYIKYLLIELAYQGYGEGNPSFNQKQVIGFFKDCMKKYGFEIDIINLLTTLVQLNILDYSIIDNFGYYRFFHQSYQMYFETFINENP